MVISIDFNSEEALYIQLCNQIIMSIATSQMREGDTLPSVRQLADNIGINMHTVNKAYTLLKQEGYIKLDRRHGAIIAIDMDKLQALEELDHDMRFIIARAMCKNVSAQDIHEMVDQIMQEISSATGEEAETSGME